MQVRYRIRGVEEVNNFIKSLPRGTVKDGLAAFSEYILGNKNHGLRHDEPQKYVSRKAAGYKTSAKQIRYFFAVGILERTSGGVKLNRYKRTGETAAAWQAVERNNGYRMTFVNDKPGAYWTRGEPGQTRQHKLAGRRTVSQVISANFAGAMRKAQAAVTAWLKKNSKR